MLCFLALATAAFGLSAWPGRAELPKIHIKDKEAIQKNAEAFVKAFAKGSGFRPAASTAAAITTTTAGAASSGAGSSPGSDARPTAPSVGRGASWDFRRLKPKT
jgi:hypothetical protein